MKVGWGKEPWGCLDVHGFGMTWHFKKVTILTFQVLGFFVFEWFVFLHSAFQKCFAILWGILANKNGSWVNPNCWICCRAQIFQHIDRDDSLLITCAGKEGCEAVLTSDQQIQGTKELGFSVLHFCPIFLGVVCEMEINPQVGQVTSDLFRRGYVTRTDWNDQNVSFVKCQTKLLEICFSGEDDL